MPGANRTPGWGWLPLALAAGGCGAAWERLDLAALPAAERFPDAPAVVLLDERQVRFQPGPLGGEAVAEVTHHRRVRILRPEGAGEARVVVHYDELFSPIIDFAARTIAPDGTARTFTRRDASDLAVSGDKILYSDDRVLHLDPPAPPGAVVEWRCTQRYTDLRLYQFTQRFGDQLPLLRARLEVSAPTQWTIEHLARRLDERVAWEPERREADGIATSIWERGPVEALPEEPEGPPAGWSAPSVQVRALAWSVRGAPRRGFQNARDQAVWFGELAAGTDAATPELTTQASKIIQETPDPRTRASRLHALVRDSVQYCAIEIGYGGWKPHAAAEVLRLRYGDCKDKANLLRALLAIAGVPSRLLAIYAHDGYPRRFGLPGVANFNHAIVLVDLPDGRAFADPTARATPFGRLPRADEDADCLPGDPNGAPLEHTPEAPPSASEQRDALDLVVQPNGSLAGTFARTATGHYADRLRGQLLREPDESKLLGDALSVRNARAKVRAIDGKQPPVDEAPIRIEGRLTTAEGLRGAGASRFLRLSDVLEPLLPPLPRRPRRDPVVLGFKRHAVDEAKFELPDDTDEPSLPPPAELRTDFATYQLTWRTDGQRAITAHRELTVSTRIVPPSRYGELLSFLDAVTAAEARAVTLHQPARGSR
jgi:Domain of Unknown Function with PDB structure (DUF3857)/Transglutaminase-like superfamily